MNDKRISDEAIQGMIDARRQRTLDRAQAVLSDITWIKAKFPEIKAPTRAAAIRLLGYEVHRDGRSMSPDERRIQKIMTANAQGLTAPYPGRVAMCAPEAFITDLRRRIERHLALPVAVAYDKEALIQRLVYGDTPPLVITPFLPRSNPSSARRRA